MRGRRHPARSYYSATSHLREYTWSELERLVASRLRIKSRGVVGWQGGWQRRAATRLVGLPPFRRLARMVVLEIEAR